MRIALCLLAPTTMAPPPLSPTYATLTLQTVHSYGPKSMCTIDATWRNLRGCALSAPRVMLGVVAYHVLTLIIVIILSRMSILMAASVEMLF